MNLYELVPAYTQRESTKLIPVQVLSKTSLMKTDCSHYKFQKTAKCYNPDI